VSSDVTSLVSVICETVSCGGHKPVIFCEVVLFAAIWSILIFGFRKQNTSPCVSTIFSAATEDSGPVRSFGTLRQGLKIKTVWLQSPCHDGTHSSPPGDRTVCMLPSNCSQFTHSMGYSLFAVGRNTASRATHRCILCSLSARRPRPFLYRTAVSVFGK
jgi:hypothetical protein